MEEQAEQVGLLDQNFVGAAVYLAAWKGGQNNRPNAYVGEMLGVSSKTVSHWISRRRVPREYVRRLSRLSKVHVGLLRLGE